MGPEDSEGRGSHPARGGTWSRNQKKDTVSSSWAVWSGRCLWASRRAFEIRSWGVRPGFGGMKSSPQPRCPTFLLLVTLSGDLFWASEVHSVRHFLLPAAKLTLERTAPAGPPGGAGAHCGHLLWVMPDSQQAR